jgi:hypothetical protein
MKHPLNTWNYPGRFNSLLCKPDVLHDTEMEFLLLLNFLPESISFAAARNKGSLDRLSSAPSRLDVLMLPRLICPPNNI